jgi:cyclopropane fatty-acyl-phospholipid synthase-like methyltransferase
MQSMSKPYSEACDQNKEPILAVLKEVFSATRKVLEIGSGTGQHAVYFARHLPHLTWQTSDMPENHPGIMAWLNDSGLPNVLPPLNLDVAQENWPVEQVDGVFSANTTHIMSWQKVKLMFKGIGKVLVPQGVFCLYGPFNYHGTYTSDSNAHFDTWLKTRDPQSGLRDFDNLDKLAAEAGMDLQNDIPMPVNNRILIWRKN